MLEVENAFMLEQYVKQVDFSTAMRSIAGGDIDAGVLQLPPGNERPFHFEFVVDPYHRADGQAGTFARVMYKRPFSPQPPSAGGESSTPSPGLLAAIAQLLDDFPGAIDRAILEHAIPGFLARLVSPMSGVVATPALIFGDTSLRTGGTSMELGIEVADVPRAAAILADTAEQNLYAGVLAFRFVRSSLATLAFTRSPNAAKASDQNPRLICTVETDALLTEGTTRALDGFWTNLDRAGVPYTLHWGQKLRQDPRWVPKAYGAAVEAWLAQRRRWLPTAGARRLFSNDLLDALELSG
jgi:hypothetical protein